MQMRQMTFGAVTAAILYGVASASASAAVVNFDQANANTVNGSVSYGGDGGVLSGQSIGFGQISLNGSDMTLTCDGCSLDFVTGDNLDEGGDDNIWTFGGGGSLTVNGTATTADGDTVADGDLFTGTPTNAANGSPQTVTKNGDDSFTAKTNGTGQLNADLSDYFGLDSSDYDFLNTEIDTTGATFADNGGFTGDNLSNADLDATTNAVPAPSELGLFGLAVALLAGGITLRRKRGGSLS